MLLAEPARLGITFLFILWQTQVLFCRDSDSLSVFFVQFNRQACSSGVVYGVLGGRGYYPPGRHILHLRFSLPLYAKPILLLRDSSVRHLHNSRCIGSL